MSSTLKILDREHSYTPTDKGLNYIIAQEFKEIFIDVFEINCGANKIIAEKVDSINGDPVIKIDTQVSGKIYSTLFVLREGKNNIILNTKSLSNGRNILKQEKAVVDGIVSEFYQPSVSDISHEKTVAIGVLHESYVDKKHKIDQFRQSITDLIDERISQIQESSTESINSAKNNLTTLVEKSINANRIDRDSTLAEINSIRENILTTVELYSDTINQTAEEKTTQLRELQEKVNFEVNTKLAELDVETKSQLKHISEAYDSIKAFITTTKEEFLKEKTSSYDNIEKLNTKANQIVSENLKRAQSLVGKKITQLQATADKKINDLTSLVESKINTFNTKIKDINDALERAGNTLTETINEAVKGLEYKSQEHVVKLDIDIQDKVNILDKTKSELATIAENQVSILQSKIKDVEDVTNKAEKSLTATAAEAVAKIQVEATAQVTELDKAKDQLTIVAEKSLNDIKHVAATLTEAVEKKVRDVTLVAVKKEDLAQLKKQLESRLDNESASLKKYVAGYGGGGSVAQQFAAGGTMNGTLNIASGQLLSGGQDLFGLLGGGGGGGGSGIDTGVRALSSNWQNTYTTVQANSASWAIDSTTDTGVRALTANWQNTYTSYNVQSGGLFNSASSTGQGVVRLLTQNLTTWDVNTGLRTSDSPRFVGVTATGVISTVNGTSTDWNSTYSTVQANSASWAVDSTIDSGVRALTGNWQNTYTNFRTQSANNTSVYSTVQTYSAAWTDTAAPTTLTYAASITPSLSDGISRKVTMTGDLTLNAPTDATDGSLWKGRFTASGADRTITLGANILTPRGTTFSGIVSSGFTRLFEMNYNGTKWWLVRNQEFAP